MTRREVLRILDANFNRSREGLRVCEEIARFIMESASLTSRLKGVRHRLSDCLREMPVPVHEVILARNVRRDVGRTPSELGESRRDALDLFAANAERVKESLRVLEELAKLIDEKVSRRVKEARFDVYAIEKKALPRLAALRDCGHGRSRRQAASGAGKARR